MVTLICSNCRKAFQRIASRVRGSKHPMCSQICYRSSKFIGVEGVKGVPKSGVAKENLSRARMGKHFEALANEKHWAWKGSEASYKAFHQWLRRNFGNPYKCEFESSNMKHLNPKRYEYALLKGHQHGHDRSRYIMLCPSCHRKYDGIGRWQKTGVRI